MSFFSSVEKLLRKAFWNQEDWKNTSCLPIQKMHPKKMVLCVCGWRKLNLKKVRYFKNVDLPFHKNLFQKRSWSSLPSVKQKKLHVTGETLPEATYHGNAEWTESGSLGQGRCFHGEMEYFEVGYGGISSLAIPLRKSLNGTTSIFQYSHLLILFMMVC